MDYQNHRILLDIPSPRPALGFEQTALALTQVIEQNEPRFAVGIFGGWGSGKTTLMESIRSRLNKSESIAVWFSAWRYEKEIHLIIPLLDSIRADLAEWVMARAHDDWKDKAEKSILSMGTALRALLRGFSFKAGLPIAGIEVGLDVEKALEAEKKLLQENKPPEPSSSYYNAFRALQEAFGGWKTNGVGKRIVVFIDDLDRCMPTAALEILESMKLFFDLPGFVFVVGLDKAVVQKAVEVKYGKELVSSKLETSPEYRISGQEYIQKIFQIPYSIAPVSTAQIDELIRAISENGGLEHDQNNELVTKVSLHLRYLLTQNGIIPREIKRYINAFTLTMKIKSWLDPDVILALQTAEFRPDWVRTVQPAILGWRDLFTRAINDKIAGDTGAIEALEEGLNVPESFLRYVGPEGPGNRLLTCGILDDYIFTGESTRSSLGPSFFDLFPRLAKLQKMTTAFQGKEAAKADYETFRAEFESFVSFILTVVPSQRKPFGAEEILGIMREVKERPNESEASEIARHLRRIKEQVVDIYQAGRLGTGSAA